jgi:hypothetical protein
MQNSNINYIAHNNRNISNSLDQYTRRIQLLLSYTRVLSRTRYNCTIGLYVLHEEDEEGFGIKSLTQDIQMSCPRMSQRGQTMDVTKGYCRDRKFAWRHLLPSTLATPGVDTGYPTMASPDLLTLENGT